MKNFLQAGEVIDVVAPNGGLTAGDFYLVGGLFGVVAATVLEGETVALHREGVFTLPKVTGTAWTQGDPLYWDASAAKFTKTAGNNLCLARAAADAASGAATGGVLLNEMAAPGLTAPLTAVADLTENTGAVGGSNDGNLPDLTATAATLTGTLTGTTNGALVDVAAAAAATAGVATPSAAQVDTGIATAVAPIVTGVNEQNKEFLEAINKLIADNLALRASVREVAAKLNTALARLRSANIITD